MLKILIASTNPGKLKEMRAILDGEPFELILPSQLGLQITVEETGNTYAENAALKAAAYAMEGKMVAVADDSGLEVAVLAGAPGLRSARYHPKPGANDADRRQYLLEQIKDLPEPWDARFTCTVAIATPQGETWFAKGECQGIITSEQRGGGGFGYDPLFYLPEFGMTMAELAEEQKNQISHRARALQAALPVLRKLANAQVG